VKDMMSSPRCFSRSISSFNETILDPATEHMRIEGMAAHIDGRLL